MSFEVVTQGLKELIARLGQPLEPIISKQTQVAAEEARKLIAIYPPAPANSKRTGNLGRSWAIQATSGATFLHSAASYAPFVVGPQQVAGAARVGWKTDEQVAQSVEQNQSLATDLANDIADLLS